MIFLSVVLGYVQEHRSSKAVEQLQAMVETNCLVSAAARKREFPMAEIVPGDIVVLQAGAIIPADLRLIAAKDFFVSQSSLTGRIDAGGENRPARRDISGRGVIELQNACFQGSNVLSGTARGRGGQHRAAHAFRLDLGKALRRAGADQLRPRASRRSRG